MAFKDFFQNMFQKKPANNRNYGAMMNGLVPLFSQFGNDVYKSDIVKWAIRSIANEIKKAQIQHIRTDEKGNITIPKSQINSLFLSNPNNLMTTANFLEKITWLYHMKNNVFIYPSYREIDDKKVYTGFYPLNPTNVQFNQYSDGEITVTLTFENGEDYEFKYNDLIHLRKDYSENELMGGNKQGLPDNEQLLQNIKTNDKLINSLPDVIASSMSLRGLIEVKSLLDQSKLDAKREEFEKSLMNAQKGFVPIDFGFEVKPFELNPKLIDKDTLEYIDKNILRNYGTSLAIIDGDYTDEQFEAFYQKALEPFFVELEQAMMKCLLTNTEKAHGNRIKIYDKLILHAGFKTKITLAEKVSPTGALSTNEIRELFGYLPIENGEERPMSLNWINSSIANDYQLSKVKMKGSVKDEGQKQNSD